MKLWLLKPVDDEAGYWINEYDICCGFVIAAEDEKAARQFAFSDEKDRRIWLDPSITSCIEIVPSQMSPGVVLVDFKAG